MIAETQKAHKKLKRKKKFTARHAVAVEEWMEGKNFKEIGKTLGIQPPTAKSLWETGCNYLRGYLNGSIDLAMPEDFEITDEIEEALWKE